MTAGLYHITGLSVIGRMELQCPNTFKSLQVYSVYPIFYLGRKARVKSKLEEVTLLGCGKDRLPHLFRKRICCPLMSVSSKRPIGFHGDRLLVRMWNLGRGWKFKVNGRISKRKGLSQAAQPDNSSPAFFYYPELTWTKGSGWQVQWWHYRYYGGYTMAPSPLSFQLCRSNSRCWVRAHKYTRKGYPFDQLPLELQALWWATAPSSLWLDQCAIRNWSVDKAAKLCQWLGLYNHYLNLASNSQYTGKSVGMDAVQLHRESQS